jgi:3-phenylpropionate/trans-cinnamate dioxygenase ferredoxin reductase component
VSGSTFVIVGAGLAGARAAEALRKEGFDGRVILLGDELTPPYERPPLTKDFLRGETDRAHLAVRPDAFYADNAIDLRLGRAVTAIDPAGKAVVVGDGERIAYDRLLLATGSRSRPLGVPGADLPGVHLLRQVDDAESLRVALGPGRRLTVIGGGWIGTEVAASARRLGTEVTVLMTGGLPLEKPLGTTAATVYRDLHVEHGVTFATVPGIASVEGAGRAEEVVTTDGRRFACDAVVAAVGASPRIELAGDAGLAIEGGGVAVDETLETSAPGVFAAGDIAAALYPTLGSRVRLEHWAAAKFQGPAAARSMLGTGAAYDRLPYFYSDQYDVSMEYRGYVSAWDRVVVRGDLAARSFLLFYVAGDRVAAAMNVNVTGVAKQLDALIRSGRPVDDRALADPDVPLEALGTDDRVD